jgi:SAM-dependent methyltransferase
MVKVMRRALKGRHVAAQRLFEAEVGNKVGLEIGGPSAIFRNGGELPIYRCMAGLDNCVFSAETIWEGSRMNGRSFSYQPGKVNGFNFIREATELRDIADHAYDFTLSSHNLEHIANPIKALVEWKRVVRPLGVLVVILPDYRLTFDHRRQPTPVEHMIEDYERGTDETDLTHLEEILRLHDQALDPASGTKADFHRRSMRNIENRCLHHHVFDERNSRELLAVAGLRVEVQELIKPFHIVLLARRPSD